MALNLETVWHRAAGASGEALDGRSALVAWGKGMTTVPMPAPADRLVTQADLDTGRLRLDHHVIVEHCGRLYPARVVSIGRTRVTVRFRLRRPGSRIVQRDYRCTELRWPEATGPVVELPS